MSEFYCNYCDYTTSHRGHLKRHNMSEMHKLNVLNKNNDLLKDNIIPIEYKCEPCNYSSFDKQNFERHNLSIKHCNAIGIEKSRKNKKAEMNKCYNCGNVYVTPSGLSKHKKKCNSNSIFINDRDDDVLTNELQTNLSNMFTPEIFMDLLIKNKELQNMMIEQNERQIQQNAKHQSDMLDIMKSQPISQNNCNNITNHNNVNFNLQVFLNETCKNALNFSEFMNSIKVTLEDLEKTSQLGYVDGITRIFINALKNTEMEQRPLHCTDIKRETIYIKEADKWDKENKEKEHLKRAIQFISDKNLSQIQEWKKENPDSLDSMSKNSEILNKLYTVSLRGDNVDKENNKIIRNVIKEVTIGNDV